MGGNLEHSTVSSTPSVMSFCRQSALTLILYVCLSLLSLTSQNCMFEDVKIKFREWLLSIYSDCLSSHLLSKNIQIRTGPWGPPTLLYEGYWVSSRGVQQPGHCNDHPLPSGAEVKERVELYVYPRAGLDRCGKSRPHWDLIPRPSSP